MTSLNSTDVLRRVGSSVSWGRAAGSTLTVAAPSRPRVLIAMMMNPAGNGGVRTHVSVATEVFGTKGVPPGVVHPGSWRPLATGPLRVAAWVLGHTPIDQAVRCERYLRRVLLEAELRRRITAAPPWLVYAQDPRSAHAAIRARGTADTRVVMAVHYNDSQAEELVVRGRLNRGGKTERAIRDFESSVVAKLDGIVYVSDYSRNAMERDVPAARRVPSTIVPNFLPSTASVALPSTTTSGTRDCISVGYLIARKNHAYLLHVLAAARRSGHRYTLTLVGEGPQRGPLESLARDLGIADQVLFTGLRSDVDDLMAGHRLYVHSAVQDNCPFVLIEAYRSGLPVVAAPVGGVPEVVGDDGSGTYWDLADPDGGARILHGLLDDEQALAEASRRAALRFSTRYAADVAGDRLFEFVMTTRRSDVGD